MVYGGKPSRGCRTCRARRIKCDEGRPTCKRCEKSRRECGGYRHEFEIVHRDQTSSTVLRNLRKAAGFKPGQSAGRPGGFKDGSAGRHQQHHRYHHHHQQSSWTCDRSATSTSPSTVSTPLAIPIAQRASCYFASNFILVPVPPRASTTPHGFMEYLVPLIESEPPGSALRYAFNACAFALLGNRAKADGLNLAELSLKEHTLALAQTHKALGNPALASSDATLAAVLLLCLYESITAIKESRMLAWRSHIDGAVNIVKARGREEMWKTRMGRLLFVAVRHHLVSRTLFSVAPLPFGTDWWMSASDTDSLLAAAQCFGLKYSDFRAEASQILATAIRSPTSVERVEKLSQRIRAVDQQIIDWFSSIPSHLRPRTVCIVGRDNSPAGEGGEEEEEVFPGPVDVYPDFVTASAWNIARVSRLMLASLAIRLTAWRRAPVDYRTTPEYGAWRRVCERTLAEIVASVPYHFGWHLQPRHGRRRSSSSGGGGRNSSTSSSSSSGGGGKTPVAGVGVGVVAPVADGREPEAGAERVEGGGGLGGQGGRSGFACGEEGPGKALPALFLMWSLACIKNHDLSTEEQRAYASGRLKFIADEVGLKYAHVVNEVNVRFPSMLIRRDGLLAALDSLHDKGKLGPDPQFPGASSAS